MTATKSINQQDMEEQIRSIRRALLIGLHSYGEIERLIDEADKQEICGRSITEEMRPIHPTGCSDTVGEFATALRLLETIENKFLLPDAVITAQ